MSLNLGDSGSQSLSTGSSFQKYTGIITYEPVILNPTVEQLKKFEVEKDSITDYKSKDDDGNKVLRIDVWGFQHIKKQNEEGEEITEKTFLKIISFFIKDVEVEESQKTPGNFQWVNQYGDVRWSNENELTPYFKTNKSNKEAGEFELSYRRTLNGEESFIMFFIYLLNFKRASMKQSMSLIFNPEDYFKNNTVVKEVNKYLKDGAKVIKGFYAEAPELVAVKYLVAINEKKYMTAIPKCVLPLVHNDFQFNGMVSNLEYELSRKSLNYQNSYEVKEFNGDLPTPNGGSMNDSEMMSNQPGADDHLPEGEELGDEEW